MAKREPPALKYTAFSVENRIISNLTHATHPDGAAYIVKQKAVAVASILEICGRRKDAWADQVEIRL